MSHSSAIYIRSSKCAGASIKSALRSNSYCSYTFNKHYYSRYKILNNGNHLFLYTILHGRVKYFQKHFDDIFSNSWKFAVVRNPWDRAVSSYFYCKRYNEIAPQVSFKEFLEIDFADMNPFVFVHSQPIFDILAGQDGCDYLDFIGRFENLQRDLDYICSKIGTGKSNLPHRHRTSHKKYWEYYDEESIEIAAEKYQKDIEYFGYKFTG
jgi:hypothetical protein